MKYSLAGEKILVTGVSRAHGIGRGIVKYLSDAGAHVAAHGFGDYDCEMGYSDAHTSSDQPAQPNVLHLPPSDLSMEGEAERVVAEAEGLLGGLTGLVLNHAHSTHCPIGSWDAKHIDRHFQVNARASMLMIQRFAESAQGGCVTLFTSGQYLGPMTSEIAYAMSKEAIRCLAVQAAVALAPQRIRVNCVNPGPNDTGYMTGPAYEQVKEMFPFGRWGEPEDAAKLVCFLHSDQADWITGQTIASEGGYNRFRD